MGKREMPNPSVYIPGRAAPQTPLERYLPQLPAGVAAAWLEANVPKGAWVLDPFGTSPLLAVEAARAGYRVAVAAGNPVAHFLVDFFASAPRAEALRAALAELAAARRGDERLEPAILELYQTACPKCGAQVPARAFIWEREATAPHAKLINCAACGEQGEYPTDEADQQRAATYQHGGPHLSRALQRIAPTGDPDRVHAEEALEAYLPRAVYALFTIINRLDGMQLSDEQRKLIFALLLSACDRATNLWAHPSGRSRPKQLSAPPVFREYNVWLELERAVDLWAQTDEPVSLMAWPEEPPSSGGISLFEGRLRELAPVIEERVFQAALAAFPRPNQAFWTLCALWAGWLWGREAIGPFALVLRRKRYDWAWHTEALHAALAALSEHLPEDTPFFGVVTESEPGFNGAALTAANLAEFRLEGMALRRENDILQVTWRKGLSAAPKTAIEPSAAVRRAARGLLNGRGEPSHYQHVHAAGLAELSKRPRMGGKAAEPGELFAETREMFEVGLTFRGSFLRFGASEQSLETGLWWLLDATEARQPLADRVEIAVVRSLLRRPGHTVEELDQALCSVFPGLLTHSHNLILAALLSYGEEEDGQWRLSPTDQPRARRNDLREIRAALGGLGQRLGYDLVKNGSVDWRGADGSVELSFHPLASAVLGELLLNPISLPAQSLLVLPGRRAGLALTKIERDPRLKQAVEDGWRFIKYRHVRRLAENLSLTRESFAELLDLDPLTMDPLQAPLL